MDIAELKQKSVAELHSLAQQLNITNYSGLRKQDLIFRIEQSLLDTDTVIRGEGVLEILPEGYGFLRSQDWNYLYGPDDIYVSPSQIKRFDLRTGDTVMGQVRPPEGGRALPGPAQGRERQLRGAREDQAPDRLRQPQAPLSRPADPPRAEDGRPLDAGGRPPLADRQGAARPDRGARPRPARPSCCRSWPTPSARTIRRWC